MNSSSIKFYWVYLSLFATLAGLACQPSVGPAEGEEENGSLVIYSGRNEQLVGPVLERFRQQSALEVEVRYGGTSELAATILEEGENSPADFFISQDAGALGALAKANRLTQIPDSVLNRVDSRFRSPQGLWVGISGRGRVVVYNTEALSESDLPDSIQDFTDSKWKDRLGWAPTNASFQTFLTALRLQEGDEATRQWLEGIQQNNPKVYPGNTPLVEATGRGEIDAGFTNHYYLYRFLAEEGEGFAARNYHLRGAGAGSLVNVAGAAILDTSNNPEAAGELIEFLLSQETQQYFSQQTYEYPLASGVEADPRLPPLSELRTPEIDLSDLDDLEGTLNLLRETGVL